MTTETLKVCILGYFSEILQADLHVLSPSDVAAFLPSVLQRRTLRISRSLPEGEGYLVTGHRELDEA